MNGRNLFFPVIILLAVFLINCSKEEEQLPETEMVFHSLVSEKDTIAPGGSTNLKATATGSRPEYHWSAPLGDIIGSGPEVIYVASPCAVGTNEITCKVTNGNQSETKSIEIVVYE